MRPLTPAAGDVVRIRSARWRISHQTPYEAATLIDVRGCDRENQGERARFLLPFEPVERLPAAQAPRVVSPRRWRRTARAAIAASSPAYHGLDSAVGAAFDILPYQLEPALAVTRGLGARLLIADAVGLGKTVQAALVIAEVLRRRPCDARAIVVCPAGLRAQWQSELRERFQLESGVLDSAAVAASPSAAHGINPWAAHRIVIASIDYLKRPEVMRSVEALIWDVGVFDEAHALSGRSDRRIAACAVADRSRTVVLLSATPHSGDDDAFARLAGIGDLDGASPLLAFRRTRGDVRMSVQRRSRWHRVRPTAAEARMHAALERYVRTVWREDGHGTPGGRLAMAVLMRRACSSAASLARSVERRRALLSGAGGTGEQIALPFPVSGGDDDEPAAALAFPGMADASKEKRLLDEILTLALLAAGEESKLRTLTRLLRRARQPAIVFTEYRDTLVHLERTLASFAPAVLHGGLPPAERQRVVNQFTAGNAGLLLATDAASEGLNLHQRCRLVVNLELPWTPLKLEQRVGRVDRIGQRRRVHAIHLIAARTAEETTVAVLWRRMEQAGRVLTTIARLNEDGTAILASIVDAAEPPPLSTREAVRLPVRLATPDLGGEAAAEAARIVQWRRLATDGLGFPPQPTVAIVRHRRRMENPTCCWAVRTVYVDSTHRQVWETLRGAHAVAVRLPPLRRAADVRRWFAAAWQPLSAALEQSDAGAQASLEACVGPPLDLAMRRERAILAALIDRRGRMAAALVQQGLFDRRGERTAAAGTAVVEEALARSEARLAELCSADRLAVARRELVFAVLFA